MSDKYLRIALRNPETEALMWLRTTEAQPDEDGGVRVPQGANAWQQAEGGPPPIGFNLWLLANVGWCDEELVALADPGDPESVTGRDISHLGYCMEALEMVPTDDDSWELRADMGALSAEASRKPIEGWNSYPVYDPMTGDSKDYLAPLVPNTDDRDLVQVLRENREHGLHTYMPGPPGTGKTDGFCAAFPDGYVITGQRGMTIESFIGQFVPDPDNPGKFIWIDGDFTKAAREGVAVLLDEIGKMPADIITMLYRTLASGVVEISKVNPTLPDFRPTKGFFVASAANPKSIGHMFDEALASRFLDKIPVYTDWDIAESIGVPAEFVLFGRLMASKADEFSYEPGMRDALAFMYLTRLRSADYAWGKLFAEFPDHEHDDLREVLSSQGTDISGGCNVVGG